MIPRRFFWIVDTAALAFAFCVAYAAWPVVRSVVAASALVAHLPVILRPAGPPGSLPDFHSLAWMIPLIGIVGIFSIELSGGYKPLIYQTRARVIFSSAFAAITAAGVVTFVLFLGRHFDSSRLFLVTFIAVG